MTWTMTAKASKLYKQYKKLCHAMQSGIAFKQDKKDQEPKHLRVGINTAMCEHGALIRLLIAKGVITEEEYLEGCIDIMLEEIERYQHEIAEERGIEPDKIQLA